jgi:hypothetical protein
LKNPDQSMKSFDEISDEIQMRVEGKWKFVESVFD